MTIRKGCCPTTGGSGTGTDRFAPLVIVGNTLEGDPAAAYTTDEFHYVPDTGNGAGIATALTFLGANGGRIYIKRGNYNFNNAGGPAAALSVPSSTIIQGEGVTSTTITGLNAGSQGIFSLDPSAQVLDMTLVSGNADAAGTGLSGVIQGRQQGILRNLEIFVSCSATGALRAGVSWTAGSVGNELVMDGVRFSLLTKTGAATPTLGIRAVAGSYVTMTNVVFDGGDLAISFDRSFVRATNILSNGFAVGAVLQTNSTAGGSGGQLILTNFRFVSDGTATAVPMDLQWFTDEITNGYISAPSAAFGVRYYRAGSTLGGSSFTNLYITGPAVGFQIRSANYVSITSPVMFVTVANGTGIQYLDSAYGSVSQPRMECAVAGATLIDISGTGGGITITSPQMQIADGGVGTTRAIRMRSTGCQVQGGFIQFTSGGTAISIEATTNCDVHGVEVFAADSQALPLVNVDGSPGCTVNGNRLIASSRNYPKIEIVNATASSVINSNRVQSANGQIGIRFAAGTANNNCVGNFCQGSTFGGGPAVTDLGVNNVAQNYGS